MAKALPANLGGRGRGRNGRSDVEDLTCHGPEARRIPLPKKKSFEVCGAQVWHSVVLRQGYRKTTSLYYVLQRIIRYYRRSFRTTSYYYVFDSLLFGGRGEVIFEG